MAICTGDFLLKRIREHNIGKLVDVNNQGILVKSAPA